MELSPLLLVRYNYLLMWGACGGLFIFGVLLYLLISGSAMHQPPLSVKENSLPTVPSMGTLSGGPTVSSSRYLSNHAPLPTRSDTYARTDAACNVPPMKRVTTRK